MTPRSPGLACPSRASFRWWRPRWHWTWPDPERSFPRAIDHWSWTLATELHDGVEKRTNVNKKLSKRGWEKLAPTPCHIPPTNFVSLACGCRKDNAAHCIRNALCFSLNAFPHQSRLWFHLRHPKRQIVRPGVSFPAALWLLLGRWRNWYGKTLRISSINLCYTTAAHHNCCHFWCARLNRHCFCLSSAFSWWGTEANVTESISGEKQTLCLYVHQHVTHKFVSNEWSLDDVTFYDDAKIINVYFYR